MRLFIAVIIAATASTAQACPLLFPARARVAIVGVAPVAPVYRVRRVAVAVQAPVVVQAPAPDFTLSEPCPEPAAEAVAAPPVVYRQRTVYRSAPVYAAPVVAADVIVGASGAQRRHARKSDEHARKAAKHADKAAYWAGRS